MRVVISACTHTAFSYGLMPLARLKLGPIYAENDNKAHFEQPDSPLALYTRRAAYGRTGLVIAMLALVAGIIALPLVKSLAVPVMTAGEGRPKVLHGSPIAPALLQPRENG